jgi:hypothetical protein
MLCRDIIAVYGKHHTKYNNRLSAKWRLFNILQLVQYTDSYSGVKLWLWRHGLQSPGAALGGSGAVAKDAKLWGPSETKVRETTIFANLARKSRCWTPVPFPRPFGHLLDHSASLRVSKRPVRYSVSFIMQYRTESRRRRHPPRVMEVTARECSSHTETEGEGRGRGRRWMLRWYFVSADLVSIRKCLKLPRLS